MRLIALSLMLVPSLGLGQQSAPAVTDQQPTIKVDVNLVNVLCTVRTKGGGLVGNLGKDDFILREDGKRQQLKYFTRETNLPLTIGLLIDVSVSQMNLIEIERRAAGAFFPAVVQKQDQAFVISFGKDAELLQDLTNSVTLLQRSLNGLQVNSDVGGLNPGPVPTIYKPKGTVLYDAVYLASNEVLKNEVGRKALILITDGEDQGSTYKLQQAVEAAQRSDAIIYSIYYVDQGFYRSHGAFFGTSDSALKRISEETGGRVFRVDRKYSLEQVFAEIQQEMRSQYSLTYSPSNPARDGSYRRLEVSTTNKDLRVQARKGYFAPDGS
ncbi:MAG: VWA domain-containing protein [Bryobacterales bacterium]|nr:VWA domain-containing protein [Bryobacterales bacterium]